VFITFEGIEGCGKSTQSRRLYNRLKEAGHEVVLSREPGGCELGQKVRAIVLNPSLQIGQHAELFLYLAARAQHVEELIEPSLERHRTVIVDRFNDSTLAYQGYGRGFPRELLFRLCHFASKGIWPDVTLLLDLPVEEALARARERNKREGIEDKEGRFEGESLSFHRQVRMGYLDIARRYPERVVVIDARGDVEEVGEIIWQEICKRLAHGCNG